MWAVHAPSWLELSVLHVIHKEKYACGLIFNLFKMEIQLLDQGSG